MNSFRVGWRGEEMRVRTKSQTIDGGVSFNSAPEFMQTGTVRDFEHSNDRPFFRRRGD